MYRSLFGELSIICDVAKMHDENVQFKKIFFTHLCSQYIK